MFCVIVEKRDKATPEPLIMKHIAPKSEVISDGWAAYCDIDKLPGECTHKVVNHSKNFKDPTTGAHTNGIEGECMHLKKPQKAGNGRARSTVESTLFEHMYRRRFKDHDMFFSLLVHITKIYDVVDSEKDSNRDSDKDNEEDNEDTRQETSEDESEYDNGPTPKKVRESSPELFHDSD